MSSKNQDLGLLIMRVGLGAMFVMHGYPKLLGGAKTWAALGGSMRHVGLELAPTFWGFMAMLAELGGGILIATGLLFQPACALLVCTMLVAALTHLARGEGLGGASHAIEAGVTFLGLALVGPGRYRLGKGGLRA